MNERHNHLALIQVLPERSRDGHLVGRWSCDCGETADVAMTRVRNGSTKSCGCLIAKSTGDRFRTHGMRYSPEYKSWQSMRRRCHNTKDKDYPRYGGVGIAVCPSWRASFEEFFRAVGPRPAGTTLDRIDGKRGYEPGNVRWSTLTQQSRNRNCFKLLQTPIGVMPLVDYAKVVGLTKGAAHQRMKRGKLEGCCYA